MIRMSEDGGEGRSQLSGVGEETFGLILLLTEVFRGHWQDVNRSSIMSG